jgi:ectoine hydroxylase-related dioxygenase (phytanoyl-CoA dioxygenase family)
MATPLEFAADSAAELQSQLLLSMEANGVAVVRGAISASVVSATRADLVDRLTKFMTGGGAETESGSHLALAPGIKEPQQRDHVQLDTDIATPVLAAAFGSDNFLGKVLTSALGEDAMMVELAVIRSHAGASAQQLHTDTTPRYDRRDGKLWTVFIPLQSVDANMGPLQVCAGSHSCLPAFADLEGDTSSWCDRHCQTITAAPGDIYLIDSRVHHRGNRHAPTAPMSRYVLYASFVQSTVVGEDIYPSKPYLRDLFPIGYDHTSFCVSGSDTNYTIYHPQF